MTTQSGTNDTNWVYTTLSVYTKTKNNKQEMHELGLFIDDVYDIDCKKPLTLNSIYEVPDCLVDTFHKTDEKTYTQNEQSCGYKSLYEFTLMEWGVLWDVVNPVIEEQNDNRIVYKFQTRSNAPIQWLLNISMIYHNLYFEITSEAEWELWESFNAIYSNGKTVLNHYNHTQNENKLPNNI